MRMITNINVFWRLAMVVAATVMLALPMSVAAVEDDGGFDVGSTFTAASGTDKVSWHGYYEFHYKDQEGKNRTFDAHKITIWMGAKINEMMFLSAEVEYEHFPKFKAGNTATNGSRGEIKIDSAQLSIMPSKNFRGYMGVFYVPFGIEYFSYPGYKNKMISRPKVMKSGSIIPGTWSDVGIGLNASIDNVGQFDMYYINGDANNGGISRDTDSIGNDSKSLGARVMFDSIDGLNFGFSTVEGKHDTLDLYTSTRQSAHLRADFDVMFNSPLAPVFIAEFVDGEDEGAPNTEVSGHYMQLSSRVSSLLEIAVRRGEYDNDEGTANNNKTETSVGLVFHLLDNFQAKVEFQKNEEEGTETDNDVVDIEFVAWW
jgi:hypothetical protein